mmetsp:Transcript_29630/g.87634  ORF Transcript_29630/g.87634 Transcript_29630/m.87634 type:complete len:235 (-) Transcript_29630:2146-2850(-)
MPVRVLHRACALCTFSRPHNSAGSASTALSSSSHSGVGSAGPAVSSSSHGSCGSHGSCSGGAVAAGCYDMAGAAAVHYCRRRSSSGGHVCTRRAHPLATRQALEWRAKARKVEGPKAATTRIVAAAERGEACGASIALTQKHLGWYLFVLGEAHLAGRAGVADDRIVSREQHICLHKRNVADRVNLLRDRAVYLIHAAAVVDVSNHPCRQSSRLKFVSPVLLRQPCHCCCTKWA